jgi:putative Ca2+/H+ antiporter (TMEM165/GDT1 family)
LENTALFEVIFNSYLLVAMTEMGDKTQLLAFILVSRFKKPWVIIAGIFVATVLNHLMASYCGTWISQQVPAQYMKWILAVSFFGFAAWVLVPDKEDGPAMESSSGPFLTTVVAFFLAEMGDKTQLSTVALAAKYQSLYLVTLGTTLGMLFSDGLAVFLGDKFSQKLSMKWIRIYASLLFVAFGIAILIGL